MKDYRKNKKITPKFLKDVVRKKPARSTHAEANEPQPTPRKIRSLKLYFPLVALSFVPLVIPMRTTPAINLKDITVVALGDSITWGYPDGKSWTSTVTRETGLNIINKGISGNKLGDMYTRLHHDVIRVNPEICIIMGGTNDVFKGLSVDEMIDNIENIVTELEKKNIMPVIGLPVPLGWTGSEEKLKHLRNRILDLPYLTIDFASDFSRPKSEFKKLVPDGIHPEGEGKRLMAERLKKELPRILKAYEMYQK